jgi:hypothetical protein
VASDLLKTLERDGIVVLEDLLSPEQLESMQTAFAARLQWLRFSDVDGFQKTELYRHMVQDVLTLDQGFVDFALHPTVIGVLRQYLGDSFRLTEAKGWKSLATRRSFHAWHGDAWYDQQVVQEIPKEVKLALYLTDVSTGEFQYIRGSHRKEHPRNIFDSETDRIDSSRISRITGRAGTAVLFDTSGVHRQGEPILEDRNAVFYNYHDSSVPLQLEDVAYYRYHPLILNAAFLGNLSELDQQILGFGDRSHYIHAFERRVRFPVLQRGFEWCWSLRLHADDLLERIRARLRGR